MLKKFVQIFKSRKALVLLLSVVLTGGIAPTAALATGPDYTIDCQNMPASSGLTFTDVGGVQGVADVYFPGTQVETITVRVTNCEVGVARDYYPDGWVSATGGEFLSGTVDWTINVPIGMGGDVWGYNLWTSPVYTWVINFNNFPAPEPTNSENPYCSGEDYIDIQNTDAYLSSFCTLEGYIADGGTNHTSDAFDNFGYLYGVNGDTSTFEINATTLVTNNAGDQKYIAENIWSHDSQEYVDVVLERHFIGNTITWDVYVYKTGTQTASTFSFYLHGGLGSDGATDFFTSNGKVVSSDGYQNDPAIIYDTDGSMTYYDGNDAPDFNFTGATTGRVQMTLVGYYDCPSSTEMQDHIDNITGNWLSNVNSDIADYQGAGCGGGGGVPTLDSSASAIDEGQGVSFSSNGDPYTYTAAFIDGTFAFSGPLGNFTSSPMPWFVFGDCTQHVVTIRLYNESWTDITKAWADSYLVERSVTLNAGTTGDCAPSHPVSHPAISKPGAPDGSQVSITPGMGSLNVNVNFSGTTDAEPTSYIITALPGGNTCVIYETRGDCNVLGLTPGVDYTLSIRAVNSFGTSDAYVPTQHYQLLGTSLLFAGEQKALKKFGIKTAKLSEAFKSAIRIYVSNNPRMTHFTCTGYLAGKPKTKAARKLAKARAFAVCSYIHELNPYAITTTIGATPKLKAVANNRMVIIRSYTLDK